MQVFGRYEIEAKLGRGAFGQVFRAYDPVMRRRLAVKVLPDDADPEALKRLRSEANIVAELSHRNIVRMYEFAEENGCPYLVMELLEGETLQDFIASHPDSSLLERIDILYQIAQGLRYAQANGVTHGDIKPANVIIDSDGVVKITDFGTAALVGNDATRRTQDGRQMGTIPYMAPELFDGAVTSQKTDVFAYGVLCYELLSGQHPFRADDVENTVFRIITEHPTSLRSIMAGCPERLDMLLDSLLQKDPTIRCGSFDDVVLDLRPIVTELRAARADEIFSEVPALIEAKELTAAREAIQQVLDLQPDHRGARQLRDEMREHEQRAIRETRFSDLKERGRTFAEAGRFGEAIDLYNAALDLKPADQDVMALVAEARSGQERARRVARLLSDARWYEGAGNLDLALEKAAAAAKVQPENHDAQALCAHLQKEIEKREGQRILRDAEELIRNEAYDEARAALNNIRAESPVRSEADALAGHIEEEERRKQTRREQEAAAVAAALVHSVRQAIERNDLEAASAALEQARQVGAKQENLNGLSEAIAGRQRERELNSVAQRVRSALQKEDFETAERELAAMRVRFGDEPLWQALEREFHDYQQYGTALLMAEQAYANGDRARAREILASILRFAKDGRAESMLANLEHEVQEWHAGEAAGSELTGADAITEESVSGSGDAEQPSMPPDEGARTAAEEKTREGAPASAKKSVAASRPKRVAAIVAGALVILVLGWILYRAARPRPAIDSSRSGTTTTHAGEQEPAEMEWKKVEGTRDVNSLERYVSAFPNGPFTDQAMDRLQDLRWQQLDHDNLDALKDYVARFPGGKHASQAHELIATLSSEEELARDRADIINALAAYEAAIRHRNEVQLRRIWPSIPEIDLHFWRDSFAKTQSISLELSPMGEPKVSGSSVRLYCRRKIAKIYLDGRPPYSDSGVVSFELHRRAAGWVIASVSAP